MAGRTSSRGLVDEALARIDNPAGEGARTFIRVFRDEALAVADAADSLRRYGIVPSPMAGVPVAVKDLCDVRGVTTLAGSACRNEAPAAAQDAPVVARLRAAGAIIIGTTNMNEFALGITGVNPHYGTPKNPWDRTTGRIPGGSSCGSAVAVSDGMAGAAVGTDTAGSIRIPSGLCGLVGFKPTARRIPRAGVFELSRSLDSVGPIAMTVADCALMDAILSGEAPGSLAPFPLAGLRFGAVESLMLDGMDEIIAAGYDRALRSLADAGATIMALKIPDLDDMPHITRFGGLSIVEGYANFKPYLDREDGGVDPNVGARLRLAEEVSAREYIELLDIRTAMIASVDRQTRPFDAVLMPTCPTIPPTITEMEDPDGWRGYNRTGTMRGVVANFLDRCALTVPCHTPGEPPVGLTLMGETMGDRRLMDIGLAAEQVLGDKCMGH